MLSLGALGIGISIVFGLFAFLLFAEVYYLLCWRRKATIGTAFNRNPHDPPCAHYLLCWRRKAIANPRVNSVNQDPTFANGVRTTAGASTVLPHLDHRLPVANFHTELVAKLFPLGGTNEMEAMHLNHLLFTIIEETKEDLDSEDGKSSKITHNPNPAPLPHECILFISSGSVTPQETPFVTPPSSPPSSTPLSPISSPSLLCGFRSSSPRFHPSPYLAPMSTIAPPHLALSHPSPLRIPPPFTPPHTSPSMTSARSSPFERI